MDRAEQTAIVSSVHEENNRFYSTPDGRALLRGLDRTFDEQWLYVFELIQNALDAGAQTVSIAGDNACFIFQHDGTERIEQRHVEGMSKVFRITRGAASVGFMGIGLKSVFKRFRTLMVSGWGWAFRFHVEMVEGPEFRDKQRGLVASGCHRWGGGRIERSDLSDRACSNPRSQSIRLKAKIRRPLTAPHPALGAGRLAFDSWLSLTP